MQKRGSPALVWHSEGLSTSTGETWEAPVAPGGKPLEEAADGFAAQEKHVPPEAPDEGTELRSARCKETRKCTASRSSFWGQYVWKAGHRALGESCNLPSPSLFRSCRDNHPPQSPTVSLSSRSDHNKRIKLELL